MGIDDDTALGRLATLWLWCEDYALDGDLRKFPKEVIESACKIPLKDLIECNFIDVRPYLRIHDWWDYVGNFLKLKYIHVHILFLLVSPESYLHVLKPNLFLLEY